MGPACPQAPLPFPSELIGFDPKDIKQDEDCQRLSITLPKSTAAGHLPVMVYIHGGSYIVGAGDIPGLMDAAPLVCEQNVIVVTVTYRLGLLGYLGGSDAARPANLGLLDQICALEWVQRNISAFGGDAANVTVFGESAGADATLHLMAVPHATKLFRRAIAQSAPLGLINGREPMNAAMLDATRDLTAQTPMADLLPRHTEAEKVAKPFGLNSGMPFGTQYGYEPLPPASEIQAAWAAVAPHVDLLIGHTAHEVAFFADFDPSLKALQRIPFVGRYLLNAAVSVYTKKIYGAPTKDFAERYSKAGGKTWSYLISWAAPGNHMGACHTVDLPLLFGGEEDWTKAVITKGAKWEDLQRDARQVRRIWADFARGQPKDREDVPGVIEVQRVV